MGKQNWQGADFGISSGDQQADDVINLDYLSTQKEVLNEHLKKGVTLFLQKELGDTERVQDMVIEVLSDITNPSESSVSKEEIYR